MITANGQKTKISRWATASYIFGILSLCQLLANCLLAMVCTTLGDLNWLPSLPLIPWGVLLSLGSLTCGIIGLIVIYRSKGSLRGRGQCNTGIVIGCFILSLLCFMVVPCIIGSNSRSERRDCQQNMGLLLNAIQEARDAGTTNISSVSDLVPMFLVKEPHCPNAPKTAYLITSSNIVCPVVTRYPDHSVAAEDGLFDNNGPPIYAPDDFFDESSQKQPVSPQQSNVTRESESPLAQDTGEVQCEYAGSLSTQVYDEYVSATVGSERMYYDNGQLGDETRYCLDNEMYHGRGATWHRNGRLATEFYCASNSINMSLYYHDNSMTARVTRWQENGDKHISDIRYFPDGRVSEAQFYDENGTCTGTLGESTLEKALSY